MVDALPRRTCSTQVAVFLPTVLKLVTTDDPLAAPALLGPSGRKRRELDPQRKRAMVDAVAKDGRGRWGRSSWAQFVFLI
eukprot:3191809-Alexandrium_andersonii.AAC.1